MGDAVLKKFDRYFLLDLLAQGGMAEIYRARPAQADGAGRIIVIKRVQGSYAENSEFIEMFKSETKVMMGFNHPNLVQLYDFGEVSGRPYIAMEYVDGKTLRQFLGQSARKQAAIPIELAVYVVQEAAAALHYAHSYRDKITGEAWNFVHRDVSPQNILISYDGNVKVIDFGIAKATPNSEATRVGVIKGKPSYLSPEQITGEKLDGRSDVFALGIVLWELLAGRKLFAAQPGENEFAVLKMIESAQTHVKPPSSVNPAVPKELDYIVLRALAKQREKRYQTAEEMRRALHKFLYAYWPEFNPSDLSQYAKKLFQDDIVADRKHLQDLNSRVEILLAQSPTSATGNFTVSPGLAPIPREDTTTMVQPPVPPRGIAPVVTKSGQLSIPAPNDGVKVELESSVRTTTQGSQPGTRSGISRNIDSEEKGRSAMTAFLVAAAAGVAVVLFGPQFGIHIPGLSRAPSSIEQEKPVQAANPAPRETLASMKATIPMRVGVFPGWTGAKVKVGAKVLSAAQPVVTVPLDSPLEVTVERDGFKPFRREFVISSAQVIGLEEWPLDVVLEATRYGYITIFTTVSAEASIRAVDPENRTVASDGRPWTLQTPIQNEKIPVGTYQIRLRNQVLDIEKTILVTVEEGKFVRQEVRMQ